MGTHRGYLFTKSLENTCCGSRRPTQEIPLDSLHWLANIPPERRPEQLNMILSVTKVLKNRQPMSQQPLLP